MWEKLHGTNANHIIQQAVKQASEKRQPSKNLKNSKHPAVAATPLHPSWEAKKLQKQREAKVNFEGKKIVFDF